MSYISESFEHDSPSGLGVSVYQCGWQLCGENHSYGPAIRDHFVIHVIVRGKGRFCSGAHSFSLEQGDGFLIWPGESTFYQADGSDPWEYYWFGFYGPEAAALLARAGLGRDALVFHSESPGLIDCLRSMCESSKNPDTRDIAMAGWLYLCFSYLCRPRAPAGGQVERYLRQAVRFIEENYSYDIGVEDVAGAVGLERSYLHRLFRSRLGKPVGRYILEYRLAKARELLEETDHSVTEIALSTGFYDAAHFSKLFQKMMGLPPSRYRRASGGVRLVTRQEPSDERIIQADACTAQPPSRA